MRIQFFIPVLLTAIVLLSVGCGSSNSGTTTPVPLPQPTATPPPAATPTPSLTPNPVATASPTPSSSQAVLAVAAPAGSTSIRVNNPQGFAVGDRIIINPDSPLAETNVITSISPVTGSGLNSEATSLQVSSAIFGLVNSLANSQPAGAVVIERVVNATPTPRPNNNPGPIPGVSPSPSASPTPLPSPTIATTQIRFATFNASLNRNAAGALVSDLSTPNNAQARAVAEVIQRINPDVLLINEFDYVEGGEPVRLFQSNYLAVSQNGAAPINFPYTYVAPSNTGIASGFDLNNNGSVVTTPGAPGYGDDAFGFGNFPGQFGMVLYSKYPIDTARIRTFQNFLWKDMPSALLPSDPATGGSWYSPEELAVFRLSSKSHWDVPILINGITIHALLSHPTPPVFDGPEDRNGRRNFDEIRLFADYITPGQGNYLRDDAGRSGGLAAGSRFVIMGDQNSDPLDGDSVSGAIQQLLNNSLVNTSITPSSQGGSDAASRQAGANSTHRTNPIFDTADFADTNPGNLRADYVLPSANLRMVKAEVFWPVSTDPLFRLVGDFNSAFPGGFPTSDHRAVWVDLEVSP